MVSDHCIPYLGMLSQWRLPASTLTSHRKNKLTKLPLIHYIAHLCGPTCLEETYIRRSPFIKIHFLRIPVFSSLVEPCTTSTSFHRRHPPLQHSTLTCTSWCPKRDNLLFYSMNVAKSSQLGKHCLGWLQSPIWACFYNETILFRRWLRFSK